MEHLTPKFWALNTNSSKMGKATDFLTHMFPGTVRTWPLKIFENGAWRRSRDPRNFKNHMAGICTLTAYLLHGKNFSW